MNSPAPATTAAIKEAALLKTLAAYPSAMVAFSAGVDSTYLLAMAQRALGERVLAVTADSPSLARSSLAEAVEFCRSRSIRHEIVATDEFEKDDYRANDGQRCYHCKSALMKAMNGLAAATASGRAGQVLLIGAIAEDFKDIRPGLKAAAEAGAQWPLAEHGLSKQEVRERSRAHGLSTWNRPAEPCLSSRVPYGEPVTPEAVRMIEGAEAILKAAGLDECRARHHQIGGGRGFLCRIEVPEADLPRVLSVRKQIVAEIRKLGYLNVALDLDGLVSGGFNRLLKP